MGLIGGVRNCRTDEIMSRPSHQHKSVTRLDIKKLYNQGNIEGDDMNSNNYNLATAKSLR